MEVNMEKQSKVQTGLRIDEKVYLKLKTLAVKDHRSINSIILRAVDDYIEDYESRKGPIPEFSDQDE